MVKGVATVEVIVVMVVKPIRRRMALEVANETRATSSVSSAITMGTMPIGGGEKKEEEAQHVKMVEVEPSVLLIEMEELGLLEHMPQQIQKEVCLNGGGVQPEFHFTGDGDTTGDIWYLDNGASNHTTGDQLKF